MIEINNLPNDPIDALNFVIRQLISEIPTGSSDLSALKKGNHSIYNDLVIGAEIAERAAQIIDDQEIAELVQRCFTYKDNEAISGVRINLEYVLAALAAIELDAHFMDATAEEDFNLAALSDGEKSKIRILMSDARKYVDESETFPEWQRKNILYHISKIENELHRDKSRYGTFLAAAGDLSGLVKQFGEDAKPISEAIQTARTITQRKIEGYKKIEKEKEPKRLPKPDKQIPKKRS